MGTFNKRKLNIFIVSLKPCICRAFLFIGKPYYIYISNKRDKIKKLILTLMVVMFLSVSVSQEQPKLGLGFEFHTFPSSFMMQNEGWPSLGIYFPVEVGALLIEPMVEYFFLSEEYEYDNFATPDSEYEESYFTFLIGILKPKVRGKIRSYYGIRFGKQWYEEDYDGADNDTESEYLIIAPTIGAEYYISDQFSFGGEGMYSMISYEEDEEWGYEEPDGGGYTTIFKQHMLIPRFIVRFYF